MNDIRGIGLENILGPRLGKLDVEQVFGRLPGCGNFIVYLGVRIGAVERMADEPAT